MKCERKNVLVIEWLSLPEDIRDAIVNWCGFGNDCILPLRSEFTPSAGDRGTETWKSSLTQEQLERYHKDQVETNGFKGDLSQFIKKHGLEVDKFLIDQKLDLEGIDEIFVDCSW